MKHNIRLLALLLALLVCFASLSACNPSEKPSDTTTADTEPVAVPPKDLDIVKDGKSNSRIIRSDGAEEFAAVRDAGTVIYNAVRETTGVMVTPETDWLQKGKEYDHDSVEILVGQTGYSESAEVYRELGFGEWKIKAVGNKIVVAAYDEQTIVYAAEQLAAYIGNQAEKGSLAIPSDISLEGVYNEMLADLPMYEGAVFGSSYLAAADSIALYLTDTDTAEYEAYLAKLAASGYKQYIRRTVNQNGFATFNSDKYTVTANYYAYSGAVRIIIEPLAPAVGLEADNKYTAVTTSQITMLGTSDIQDNGLSLVVRLEDGRFVVVDGGHNREEMMIQLRDRMLEQSAEYRKAGEKIVIAAWLITHTHTDHNGAFREFYPLLQNDFKLERLLYSPIDLTEQEKSIEKYGDDGLAGGNSGAQTEEAARALGGSVMYVHSGQVFHLADLKLEVLLTVEDVGPALVNAFNGTSTVFKMTFGGKTSFIVTGDATNQTMGILNKTYGEYLKSDILQVNHHGGNCFPISGTAEIRGAFGSISPSLLLWPTHKQHFDDTSRRDYNVVLFTPEERSGGKNANFKEVYYAGVTGEYIVVPLPYEAGNVQVFRKN